MPQLTGPEQKYLVDTIVEHLSDPSQLDRALLHADLGGLATFAGDGSLAEVTSEVVRQLSSRYRVVEMVEAVLGGDHLRGNCPPLETWLGTHRERLNRLRDHPPNGDRSDFVVSRRWWLLGIGSAAALLAALLTAGVLPNGNRSDSGIEIQGQQLTLDEALGSLLTALREQSARAADDVHERIRELAKSKKGSVFIGSPLEADQADPLLRVKVEERTGLPPPEDLDARVEIYLVPRARDQKDYQSGALRIGDGSAEHQFRGLMSARTVIVVFFVFDRASNHPTDQILEVALH